MQDRNQLAFAKFDADLRRFQRRLEGHMDKLVQHIFIMIAENVIVGGEYSPGTPIDTGYARASWWVRLETVATQAPLAPGNPNRETPARDAMAEAIVQAMEARAGMEIYLLSNTEYMPSLEYGHSAQAPAGMIRLTLAAGQSIVDSVARQMGAT